MASKAKSEVVRGIDLVQSAVASLMKGAGFRKRGRSFNRGVDDGLVQVVTFYAGEYPLGENYVVPGLRENLYGWFTVNLGVFVPEVFALENDEPPPKFVQEHYCEIREGLGGLVADRQVWWSATEDVEATAGAFPELFQESVLPFFSRFDSRRSIIDEWRSCGELPFQNAARSSLAVAVILHTQGERDDAVAALRNAIDASCDHKGFQEYVRSMAERLSLRL